MNKDFDDQLMMIADEKCSYTELRRGTVRMYLNKLDKYTREIEVQHEQIKKRK